MGRCIVVLSLIANLLLCPFRCMSGEWGTAAEDASARSACSCCQPTNKCSDAPSQDEEPEDDCSCPNCICAGATRESGPKVSPIDVRVAVSHWLTHSDAATQRRVSSDRTCTIDEPSGGAGGCAVLIAFQVWLI